MYSMRMEEERDNLSWAQPQKLNMNIRNYLPNGNTPAPIARDLPPGMQQACRAANAAVRDLRTGGKVPKRTSQGPGIKCTDNQRYVVGQLAATTSTANALKKSERVVPIGK